MRELTHDESILNQWIGKTQKIEDVICPVPARLMCLLLDTQPGFKPGDELPPLWHWLYFLAPARQSFLGPDGHAALGDFLPPVALPRRMWAGGSFEFHQALKIGDKVTKASTITDVTVKQGSSGKLCFVTVKHEYVTGPDLRLIELHDIVYRDMPKPGSEPRRVAAPENPDWTIQITPGPVMLFRYSALTFNSHRIHYDRDYCINTEGYPGLVVHGPLIASLLVHHAMQHHRGQQLRQFSYKAMSPLFDTSSFSLHGKADSSISQLWACDSSGHMAMQARLEFNEPDQ